MKTDLNTQNQAVASRDKLAADIAAIAGEAGELLKEFSGDKVQRARQALTQAESAVRNRASGVGSVAGDYVHAHPWRAIGIASAAALVVGLLVARR
jgi:ElaB/YqjD/DUF883 family membrane-anchored ribosome-binding protein